MVSEELHIFVCGSLLPLDKPHRIRVSVIRREIYQCWNWYGSDLQTLEDQANRVLKKFHDVDPR